MKDVVECVARAADPAIWVMVDFYSTYDRAAKVVAEGVAEEKKKSLNRARASVAALDAAGLAIVPREPTFKMVLAVVGPVKGAEETWRAMVEAANE